MHVIGMDGGGTKTKGVIATAEGTVLAEVTVGSTNPNSVGRKDLENAFSTILMSLARQHNQGFKQVTRIFVGMSGVRDSVVKKEMAQLITSLLEKPVQVDVDNDAVIALYSGTLGASGIVQIAGTGSITYGINDQGKRDRIGGWGHLLGESGSGFSIGSDALKESFLIYDGGKRQTELVERICAYFQEPSLPEILPHIYQADNVKEQIASLSKIVINAADNGDIVANNIIHKHGLYIGDSIIGMINKLFEKEKNNKLPIVLTGGLFNRLDLFEPLIQEKLSQAKIDASLIKPVIQPVGGAVVAALQAEGINVQKEFSATFKD